jgi:hypothetical protein
MEMGTVAQACNPRILGGGDLEDLVQGQPEEKFRRLGVLACDCFPTYVGINKGGSWLGCPGYKGRSYSETNETKRA